MSSIIESSPEKSCSLDPIPKWWLVKCEPFVLPTITSIINLSITLTHVPSTMKSAIINPLLKKINLALLQKNYRPVSNLKYLSKLIERVIAQNLNEHLTRNDIFEPMQSAYRKAHSAETALVRIQNDILRATDNNEVTILHLLDLPAAFDTVNHAILINRLEKSVRIKGDALKWFV